MAAIDQVSAGAARPARAVVAVVVVLAAVVALGVLVATRDGILRGTDSEVYLATSDSIWDGDGLVVPFTTYTDRYSPREAIEFDGAVPLSQFAPGYPVAISVARLTGLDGPDATRLLHALLAAVDIWLFVLLVRRLTPTAPWWVLAAGGAILIVGPRGANLLLDHVFVASETLFVTGTLASLLLLDWALRSKEPARWVVAALVVGATLATRFAGAGLAVVASGAALFAGGLRRVLWVAALALAPTALFALWSTTAGASDRPIGWHPPERIGHFLFETMAEWFSPRGMSWLTGIVIAAGLVLVVGVALRQQVPTMWTLCGAFVATYFAGILAAGILFDHSLPVAGRLLSPLQPIVVALLVAAAARVDRWAPVLAGAMVLLLVVPGLRSVWRLERDGVPPPPTHRDIALLDGIDEDVAVFTNDPLGVYYDTGRSSYLVPRRTDVFTGGDNDVFAAHIAELYHLVCADDAVVLMRGASPFGVATEEDLGLARVATDADDALLGCA